ncbi:3-phosphoshikimate 1-carboxyvinyltransferase [Desulfonatronum zhilinae]|nr:3-phosphoshikimate 1-carboxyvinyltransferase [Desulfonatronum zhilinae]
MNNRPSYSQQSDPDKEIGSPHENTSGAIPSPTAPDGGAERREPLYRLEERLLREERNVAAALLRRSRLLAEIAARRKGDSSRAASNRSALQNLEKALWAAWENVLQPEEGGRSKHWHQLLSQCNNLGYILGEQKDVRSAKPWILRPGSPKGPVALPGPTDLLRAEIAIYWATAANAAARTRSVRTNDDVIELIKALNQVGAALAWERDLVTHTPRRVSELDFDQKTVHVGQSPFTLALLLASALARPGIAKFSGSGSLKMLALKPWQQFLPRLGARLHQLNPHAPGLPVRLECNGSPEHAQIDGETPEELTIALLVAAPFYSQGLRLTWDRPDGLSGLRHKMEAITEMYDLYGVPYSVQPDAITVSHALPRLPGGHPQNHSPDFSRDGLPDASPGDLSAPPSLFQVPLDRTLCAMLLIWSRITGWAMRLEGRWPKGDPTTDPLLALLRSCGLVVTIDPQGIQTQAGPWPAEPILDIQGHCQSMPLAVALALGAPAAAMLKGLPLEYDRDAINALANWSGRTWRQEDSSLFFQPMPQGPERNDPRFAPPDAAWAMAAAMLAFRHPGIHLTSPGELTESWPGFWTLYNHVLTASAKRPGQRPEQRPEQQPAQRPKHAATNSSRPTGQSRPAGSDARGDIPVNDVQRTKRRVKL